MVVVLANGPFEANLSDTVSFTDSIATLLTGSLTPGPSPLIQILSFSDSTQTTLHFTNKTVSSATGTGNITTNISNGTLTSISTQQVPATNPPPLPPNAVSVNLPHGLIAFNANTTAGGMITLTIQYPSLPSLASNQYFKLVGGTWEEVKLNDTGNLNGYFTLSGTTVTLHIKDNGTFDANNTPGVVSDPGGIAVVTVQPPAGGGGGAIGGGGGGGTPVIQVQRSTVQPTITLDAKKIIQVNEQLTISGIITDQQGNRLPLDATLYITVEGKTKTTYKADLKNGEYSLTVNSSDLLRAVKSRDVSITVTFNGFEVQSTPSRIVEYKAAESKVRVSITADTMMEKVRVGKRAVMLTLDNFTDSSIAKITFHVEGGDGKIVVVKAKDFDRKRISMQEVELTVKKGKSVSFADIVKIAIVKEGKVMYRVYDDTGRLIKEGGI